MSNEKMIEKIYEPTIPVSQETIENDIISAGLWSDNIEKAFHQAVKSHTYATTKDGANYLEHHLWPVVYDLLHHIDQLEDEEKESTIAIAILHDILEDDPYMTEQIIRDKFPANIADGVIVLSRMPEYKGADDATKLKLSAQYMQALIHAPKNYRLVKLADRHINLYLVKRMANTKPSSFARYKTETETEFIPLAKATSQEYLELFQNWLANN